MVVCVQRDRVGMIGIHMVDCRLLEVREPVDDGYCKVDPSHEVGPTKARVEARSLDGEGKEMEIAEIDVERCLWVPIEVAPFDALASRAVAVDLFGPTGQGNARVRQRVALARLPDKQATARIGDERLRVG